MSEKVRVFSKFNIDIDYSYHKKINVYVDIFDFKKTDGELNILVLQEPYINKQFAEIKYDDYDYVFTYFDDVLLKNNKAVNFVGVNTWIPNYVDVPKEDSVSTLVGGKSFLPGHRLRHELFHRRSEIKYNNKFYLSSHYRLSGVNYNHYNNDLILGDNKDVLFNSKYHVVIENEKLNNMYTEKILDCFASKTMPIYWGCPNIGDFFNSKGVVIVNDLNELIEKINNLSNEYYMAQEAIIENYNKSKEFTSYGLVLKNKLNEILP